MRLGRPSSAISAAFLATLALGCASAPPPERLELELPERWTAAPEEIAGERPAGAWWSDFKDPRLDRLIAESLEANRDLAAAAARVEAAAAQARLAGADSLPQVGAGLDGVRQRRNFIGFPIPGGGPVLSTTSTTLSAALNVSWEVDLWGRLRAGEAAALASLQAAEAELGAARLSLAGQTAKAWFALLEARQQVALAAEIADNQRSTRERIERRYRLGTRPALDLRLAIANQASAEAALAARRRQHDAAERRLELLLSRYPGRRLGLGEEGLPDPPPAIPAGLPAALVARRPDLIAAERRLAAAGMAVEQARAALYPQLRLTGSSGRVSAELEDLLDSDFSVWALASSLLQPVFQGGRLRAAVDLNEARYRELAERYVQAALRAFAEVELALAGEESLGEQVVALEAAAEQAEAARRLAEDRYDAGLVGYLSVLAAQREANQARTRLLETRRLQLEARVDLHLALGGDFV